MNIEVKIDKNYSTPQVIILSNKMTSEISTIVNKISNITQESLQAYKDHKLYILKQDEIEYLLDCNSFIRISNSEIINFDKVKNIDFKIIGTLIFNFKSGNKLTCYTIKLL